MSNQPSLESLVELLPTSEEVHIDKWDYHIIGNNPVLRLRMRLTTEFTNDEVFKRRAELQKSLVTAGFYPDRIGLGWIINNAAYSGSVGIGRFTVKLNGIKGTISLSVSYNPYKEQAEFDHGDLADLLQTVVTYATKLAGSESSQQAVQPA